MIQTEILQQALSFPSKASICSAWTYCLPSLCPVVVSTHYTLHFCYIQHTTILLNSTVYIKGQTTDWSFSQEILASHLTFITRCFYLFVSEYDKLLELKVLFIHLSFLWVLQSQGARNWGIFYGHNETPKGINFSKDWLSECLSNRNIAVF